MFQELAQQTAAHGWAIASMLFFISVFALVVVRMQRTSREELLAQARLPLEEPTDHPTEPRSLPQ
jgi:hypothetical protein